MTDKTFELADVEHLAATLDPLDLDDQDRATLHAIFALAGQQATSGDEVGGFDAASPKLYVVSGPDTTGSLLGSFQWGINRRIGDSLNPQPLPP